MRRASPQLAILRARERRNERVPDLGADDRKAAKKDAKDAKKDAKDALDETGQLQARIVELEESRDSLALALADLAARVTALESP